MKSSKPICTDSNNYGNIYCKLCIDEQKCKKEQNNKKRLFLNSEEKKEAIKIQSI